ncbi:MAG: pseudouridine synthase [Bacteroidales bacterium]|nr:pseudouridine synthase [Bacteroidales bacterium]
MIQKNPSRRFSSPRKESDSAPKRTFTKRDDRNQSRPYRAAPRRDNEVTERPYRAAPRRDDNATERPRRSFRTDDRDEDRPYRPAPRYDRDAADRPRQSSRQGAPRRDNDATERPRRSFSPSSRQETRTDDRAQSRPYRPAPRYDRDDSDRPRRSFRQGAPRFDRDESDRPRRSFVSREPRHEEKPRQDMRSRQDVKLRPRRSKPVAEEKPQARVRTNPEFVKDEMRLNKFISNSGVCSRREADEYITAGLVTVNGEVVTQMGIRIKSTDDIRFNGERLQGEEKAYILMNKPKDYVTTTDDPHAEQTVLDIIAGSCTQRVYPVGRLDKSTTGVLLLTNDGALTEQLTHPSYNRKKIYQVDLDKNLSRTDMEALVKGIELEDGMAQVDEISYVDENEKKIGVEIHSGRNRIIRRMFEHLGYTVKKLDRVYFAGLTKKNLRRGAWRFLTPKEIAMLKMGSYE